MPSRPQHLVCTGEGAVEAGARLGKAGSNTSLCCLAFSLHFSDLFFFKSSVNSHF